MEKAALLPGLVLDYYLCAGGAGECLPHLRNRECSRLKNRIKNKREHCLKDVVDQAVDEILKGTGKSKWERDEISRKKLRSGNVN